MFAVRRSRRRLARRSGSNDEAPGQVLLAHDGTGAGHTPSHLEPCGGCAGSGNWHLALATRHLAGGGLHGSSVNKALLPWSLEVIEVSRLRCRLLARERVKRTCDAGPI